MSTLSTRRRGWVSIQAAYHYAKSYPALLFFPFFANCFNAAFIALVITPYVQHEKFLEMTQHPSAGSLTLFFIVYLLLIFVIRATHVLFTGAAISALTPYLRDGTKHHLRFGLSQLAKRFYWLMLWAIFAGTIGIVLLFTNKHAKRLKNIKQWLKTNRWPFAGYFALSLIMDTPQKPTAALRESSRLLEKGWGNTVMPRFGIVFYIAWLRILSILPALLGIFRGTKDSLIIGFSITAALVFIISVGVQTLLATLHAVIYLFVKEDRLPSPFSSEWMAKAFVPMPDSDNDD